MVIRVVLLLLLLVLTIGYSEDEQCKDVGCAAANPELEARRKEARAFGKTLAGRYMDQARAWVNRANEYGRKHKLTERTPANDDAFKMSWSALNSMVAALDYDPDNSTLWSKSAHMLLTLFISEDGDPVQNAAVVLKFMQRAINLDDDRGVAIVKSFTGLLKKLDPERQYGELWHQVEKWSKDPGLAMNVESALFGQHESLGDAPSSSATRSDDPTFAWAPMGSQLLEENTETKKTGRLTTHQLWPTRVSVINLIDEQLLTNQENDALTKACTSAHKRFVKREEKRHGDTSNGGFFHAQADEIYDPDQPTRKSPGFGKGPTSAAVYKLWELQHNLSIEHILGGGARQQHAKEFSRNVMFPWCAVYFEGTDHAPHVHEDAIVSGVYYSQTPPGASQLVLSDPRGGTHMATSGKKANSFVPQAPFHHQYHFHPKAGDMILFPSYLVHQVPSNPASAANPPRVAWPFNLFADLDAWARINT